jgi:VanZ family protein
MLPLVHARLWVAASAALVLLLIYGSLGPGVQVTGMLNFDKLQHFGVYCVLAVWFTGLVARRHYWMAALALVCLGIGMEIIQQQMGRGRVGDSFDAAANTLGVAAGVVVALFWTGGWAPRVEAWLARR